MSDNPVPILSEARKPTLGDRIRGIANQIRQESDVQIKATSRILGAAAQIAQNHDHLIDEVVDMVAEDLDHQERIQVLESYTVKHLQDQFKTLKAAKAHFDIKATSWVALVFKLNEPTMSDRSQPSKTRDVVTQRLEAIECDIQTIRGKTDEALNLLSLILKKLS